MIIALPATDHDHLADALVRDLGFTRVHADQPLHDLLLELDPFVDGGTTLANMGASPRLSSRLEQAGTWARLLNPPRPGAVPDRVAAEVKRLLDVLRRAELVDDEPHGPGDVVVIGGPNPTVAIDGRYEGEAVKCLDPAGVVGEQQAVVAYVQELREVPSPAERFAEVGAMADEVRGKPFPVPAIAENLLENDPA